MTASHNARVIEHCMLYGVPLPAHLSLPKEAENWYSASIHWQVLCAIYRHYPHHPLEWIHTMSYEYIDAFKRLHPVMLNLYGYETMMEVASKEPTYPICTPTPSMMDSDMLTYRCQNWNTLGLDADLVYILNQQEAKRQTSYLVDLYHSIRREYSEYSRVMRKDNQSPANNISRHDFNYAAFVVKEPSAYIESAIAGKISMDDIAILNVFRSSENVADHMMAVMLNLRHNGFQSFKQRFNFYELIPHYKPNQSIHHLIRKNVGSMGYSIMNKSLFQQEIMHVNRDTMYQMYNELRTFIQPKAQSEDVCELHLLWNES